MKIGLVSDSFGNLDLLSRALEVLNGNGAERIFFLGGKYGDVDIVAGQQRSIRGKQPAPIVRVASRACPEYNRPDVPKKQIEMAEMLICCLVHDKRELTRDDISNATVLFYGNSTHAAVVQIGPRYFVTPGHLRNPAPEGKPATFAMVDLSQTKLELIVFDAQGQELKRETAAVGARSKVSIK